MGLMGTALVAALPRAMNETFPVVESMRLVVAGWFRGRGLRATAERCPPCCRPRSVALWMDARVHRGGADVARDGEIGRRLPMWRLSYSYPMPAHGGLIANAARSAEVTVVELRYCSSRSG